MPLTTLQKDILAILAGNRSEESHFAGGIVLNAADDSARFSYDFDIFHELAEEVTRSSERNVESLRRADFQVDTQFECLIQCDKKCKSQDVRTKKRDVQMPYAKELNASCFFLATATTSRYRSNSAASVACPTAAILY
jgi:hypothetical protein